MLDPATLQVVFVMFPFDVLVLETYVWFCHEALVCLPAVCPTVRLPPAHPGLYGHLHWALVQLYQGTEASQFLFHGHFMSNWVQRKLPIPVCYVEKKMRNKCKPLLYKKKFSKFGAVSCKNFQVEKFKTVLIYLKILPPQSLTIGIKSS